MHELKIRCSSISKIMGEPKLKADKEAGKLSETAKSAVQDMFRQQVFGFNSFQGDRKTEKGLQLEESAIKVSGFQRGLALKKNSERRENDFISGECDIYVPTRKLIIDTKCPWDIGSHPFFECEAEKKVKEMGYDWQMQGYMWLWDCEQAQIDFVLLPTPLDLLTKYDNIEQHLDLVENIPLEKRITTVTIQRDEEKIAKIQTQAEKCQAYFSQLLEELKWQA